MRLYKFLNEDSFTIEDIPKNFYIVFDTEDRDTFRELKKHEFKDATGISGSNKIQFNFLGVARNAMLEMDSDDFMKVNNVTRIMYDNPHYLVSKNLWALRRLFNSPKDRWKNQVFFNIFSYMIGIMKSEKKWSDFVYDAEYHGIVNIDNDWAKKKHKINNISDLAKVVKNYIDNVFVDKKIRKREFGRPNHPGYDISLKELQKILYKTLKKIGETYADETEWIIKGDSLKIPKGSNLYILLPKAKLKQDIIDFVKKNIDKDNDTIAKEMRDSGVINKNEIMQYVLMNGLKPYRRYIEMEEKLDDIRGQYNIIFVNADEFENKRKKYFKNK